MLTAQQVEHYRTQGYVLVPQLLSATALARYNSRFIEFVNGAAAPADAMKIMRDIMVVKGAVEPASPLHGVNKLINFEADPALYAYALEPHLLTCVRQLIGSQVYSVSTNVFNKPPGVDGRHPMHQDLRYFRIRPADKIIASWTAINPASRASGCLAVIPGSHKQALHDHANPDWDYVNAGFFAIDDIDLEQRVHIPMQPGDTLLFHPLLIHGSGHNRSNDFRRSISAHFAAADCKSASRDWRVGKQARKITC